MGGMISTSTYGLIEVTLTFGGVLVFCIYQLWSVRRAVARRKAREVVPGGSQSGSGSHQECAAGDGRRGIR